MFRILFTILLQFSSICIYAQKDTVIIEENNKRFINARFAYEITVPESWVAGPSAYEHMMLFYGPNIDSANLTNDGSFGVNILQLPKGVSTQQALKQNLDEIKNDPAFSDFKITEQKPELINGKKFEYVIYQFTMNNMVISSLQYYLSYKDKLYILGGSIPSETWGKYRLMYKSIARTFKLNK